MIAICDEITVKSNNIPFVFVWFSRGGGGWNASDDRDPVLTRPLPQHLVDA